MSDSNYNSKTLTVQTELGEVVVHKMPLSDYAELLRALSTLPGKIDELLGLNVDPRSIDNGEFLQKLPTIISDSWNDIAAFLAVPTDKDAAFLLQLDGADALEVIDAILELNDVVRITSAVKKIWARRAKMATPTPAPSEQ